MIGNSALPGQRTATGREVETSDRRVTIAGRAFELGAVYGSAIPPPKAADAPRVPRRLVAFDPAFEWPDGLVIAELLEAPVPGRKARRLRVSGAAWARWAGKEVEP